MKIELERVHINGISVTKVHAGKRKDYGEFMINAQGLTALDETLSELILELAHPETKPTET